MYIKSVHLENIRCIEQLDLAFEEGHEAGWHVLIGENGSGKTTVARAIALGLVGRNVVEHITPDLELFRRSGSVEGYIDLLVIRSTDSDELENTDWHPLNAFKTPLAKDNLGRYEIPKKIHASYGYNLHSKLPHSIVRFMQFDGLVLRPNPTEYVFYHDIESIREFNYRGWFVSGFGPFRRFLGGNAAYDELEEKVPLAKAIVSLFKEDAAFGELLTWINKLYLQFLEGKNQTLERLLIFLNHGDLLPHGVKLKSVSSDGVFFENSNKNRVSLHDLSDGYRSVLSLTLELIRQLLRTYGEENVFANVIKGEMNIPVPGVVIIDEVDAHLHPTWQTQIGHWFTRYFPALQFIVTTHSPLICRACGEHGKIFRLAAPGSKLGKEEIKGTERDKLVYGDILAAYETDAFGDKVEWGQEGRDLQKEYRDLAYKRRFGVELTEEETKQYERLKAIFKSHVEVD